MRSISHSAGSSTDSLEELLRDKPSDEKQGANATQGFGFQQWWAALSVAELLSTQKDFAVGMEVKDDIALLDSATSPTTVEFCQIKKNEQAGAWTLKELHKQGKKLASGNYELSILGKLYKRRHEFTGHPTRLRFVSNVSFKVPAEDDSMVNSHETELSALNAKQQNVLKEAIATQLSIPSAKVDLAEVHLHRTDLPLGQQEVFIGGKLSQLCEKQILPFAVTQPTVAARMLASELQTKASNTSYARSFDDLKARLFSRADALSTLAMLSNAKPTLSVVLDEAIERLNAEQYDFLSIKKIKAERVRVCANAVDRTNMLFRNLAKALIDAMVPTANAAEKGTKLGTLMENLIQNAKKATPSEFLGWSSQYVNALALLVLNDGIDINVFASATGTESEEKE